MKLISLTLLILSGCAVSRSENEEYEVVSSLDPVVAVAGEDVILPCFVKPNINVVDTKVEWFRISDGYPVVHIYEDHEDKNTEQIQSYRGRTKLNHQELQRGNASLKLLSVKVSDQAEYKCLIQSSWTNDAKVVLKVEAVGSTPVITVDGFDGSGGLHLQCETEGWFPQPHLEWLDREGVDMTSKTTESHSDTEKFGVKNTIIVQRRDSKIHCKVTLGNHSLETQIITTSNIFLAWRISIITISVFLMLSVIAGITIAMFVLKNRVISRLRKHKVNVILDAGSAHPQIFVSQDGKGVRDGSAEPNGVDRTNGADRTNGVDRTNDKFNEYLGVLGKEGFSSGCFYYEVQVKGQTEWDLGVTRESAERHGRFSLSPMNGYWTLGLSDDVCLARESGYRSFSLSVKPQRVGVFVDYEKCFISFYDVESSDHIYSYTGQSFNEKLYPFVSLGCQSNKNPIPLIICEDY